MSTTADSTGLLFPGQGAHEPAMLDAARHAPRFNERYEAVTHALGMDPLAEFDKGDTSCINRNRVSSMLTALVSTLALDRWLNENEAPKALAGYSVGQWTALYAAGAVNFEELCGVIAARAECMDRCFENLDGTMAAFLGVHPEKLEEYLEGLRQQGHYIVISNYNCLGNYSVAGTREAVELAVSGAEEAGLRPRKVALLPVAGAWHCSLLDEAAREFAARLETMTLNPRTLPVIDNTTGDFLPESGPELNERLSLHISRPVRWEQGMRTLIARGCDTFTELGHGEVLTKFGFFIDRNLEHAAFGVSEEG